MTEKDWKLLLYLHEEGTITKTAQKLYISQPALTYRIKQIEREFNIKIIYRGSKGVIFTNEGEYLLKYAKLMIKQLRKAKEDLQNMAKVAQGTLRLGVSSNFALYQLPVLLEGFLAKYPKVEVNLQTGLSSSVLNLIQSEEVHIGIVRGEHLWPKGNLTLDRETLCIASKEKIVEEALPYLNQIKYQTDVNLRNTFDQWWQQKFDVPPKILMEVDQIETCKQLVKKGLGYGLFPSISLKEEDNLHTIDLTINNKKILRPTSLLFRDDLLDLNVVDAFISFIKSYYGLDIPS